MARGAGWKGVGTFLAIAYGLSWAMQIGVAALVRGTPLGISALGGGVLVAAVFLMWPPAIGAFVARRWLEGGNFEDAGLRWPPLRYLLLAWFGPPVLTALAALLSLPIYPFDPSLSALEDMARQANQELPVPAPMIALIQIAAGLTIAVPINCIFAFGEEFGWRGYLLPRLQALLGPWPGLLLHGAIWGFWHAPLIFLIGYNYPGHNVIGVPLFVVTGMLLGVLFGWLHLASRSVVCPTVAHASLNATAGAPLLLLRGVDPAVGGVLFSPIGWIALLVAAALVLRDRSWRSTVESTERG
jgi:membrane protease YdiL (CAAX protease family)